MPRRPKTATPTAAFSSFVNGRFLAPEGQTRSVIVAPETGETIGTLFEADATEIGHAVHAAQQARDSWRVREVRLKVFEQWAILAKEQDQLLLTTIRSALGLKPARARLQADALQRALDLEPTLISQALNVQPPYQLQQESLGVVSLLMGWNNPVGLAMQKLCNALLAGNTVVFKPSEFTAPIFHLVVQWGHQAGLPRGVLNMVNGRSKTTGRALLSNPRLATLGFSGNGENTQSFAIEAARYGKLFFNFSPRKPTFIVLADADFEHALAQIFSAVFLYPRTRQGWGRILVQRAIATQFMNRIAELVDSMTEKISTFCAPDRLELMSLVDLMPHPDVAQAIRLDQRAQLGSGAIQLTGPNDEEFSNPYAQSCYVAPSIWLTPDLAHPLHNDQHANCVISTIETIEQSLLGCQQWGWQINSLWSSSLRAQRLVQKNTADATLGINTVFDHQEYDRLQSYFDQQSFSRLKIFSQHNARTQ